MNVSFIGAGNLAWHLAPALDNSDFPVKEVYSRDTKNAEALVGRLYESRVQLSLDFSFSSSRIFIIAVADDAIVDVVQEIILPEDAILLHTSGSQPLSSLDFAATQQTGVLYPLQTFSRNRKVDFKEIPFFIESNDPETERLLMTVAKTVSKKVFNISSEERKALHIAAVFASNFTNHMLAISQDLVRENGLDFEHLKPLIAETINKSLTMGPDNAQTGPAKRGDLEILDKHLEFLQSNESVSEIYRVISQNIVDRYEP